LKQYEKDRAARDVLNSETTPRMDFQDHPLQKALDGLQAQLEHR